MTAPLVYGEDRAEAYFNDAGQLVPPAQATWAKVWRVRKGGEVTLQIVMLEKEAVVPPA